MGVCQNDNTVYVVTMAHKKHIVFHTNFERGKNEHRFDSSWFWPIPTVLINAQTQTYKLLIIEILDMCTTKHRSEYICAVLI
jgi:hypothetical protein